MSEPVDQSKVTTTPAPEPEPSAERTFTQAEVDTLIGKRLAKAMKGMPGEEELSAFRAWKESQQTEKEKWDNLTKERDDGKAALAAAQAELEEYKREKYLLGKGVSADDVDFYAFKIGKLVTDSKTFEQAAEEYFKDNQPSGNNTVRVDMSKSLGGGTGGTTPNDTMNGIIRGFRK